LKLALPFSPFPLPLTNNMDTKNQDSRYLIMWACVIVTGAIVFVGWLWVVRHNIDQTNAELGQGAGSMEQVTEEMQKMFGDVSEALKKNEAAKPAVVEAAKPATIDEVKPAAPTVNANKK